METKNGLVVKNDVLIQARHDLSLIEQKLILYAVSMLDREREYFSILPLRISEFSDIDGSLTSYSEIREVVLGIMDKTICIPTENGELITGWIASLEYKYESGIIELEFSKKLMPYFIQLKNANGYVTSIDGLLSQPVNR